jgi:methionyl-tRNA synthetase
MEELTFEEFKKMDLRVGKIKEVLDHPQADKLYLVNVEIGGEEKQVVAGIKPYYTKEELVGKLVVVVNNLKPSVIRGVESKGMVLAATDTSGLAVITLDKPIAPGSVVK